MCRRRTYNVLDDPDRSFCGGKRERGVQTPLVPAGTGMKKYRDVQLNTELEAEEEAEELDESDAVETEAVETAESADLEEVVLDEE